ncbi:MAG: tRNA (cytidine(56)-2'-O)-methyltransferase [Candidatus Odinarchaeia archaeon]
MVIGVLRLNHRIERDKRVTSHVFLTARAFGCDFAVLHGEKDENVLKSIEDVVERWGGFFKIKCCSDFKQVIKEYKMKGFKIIHLTIYGKPLYEKISKLRDYENLLIVVGGSKVPREVYSMADFNISVGTQPHSEIAALAVFLHELYQGEELNKVFENSKIQVIPQEKGKKVVLKDV